MMKYFLGLIFQIFVGSTSAQHFYTECHAIWDDRMTDWEFVIESEDGNKEVVELTLLWPLKRSWNEWRIDGTLLNGTIKTKWPNDITQWELRSEDQIVLINQVSRGNANRWEIREGTQRLIVSTRFRDDANSWWVPSKGDQWHFFTEYEGDPRDWIIEDYLDQEYSLAFRLAMNFIAIWHSIPKN